MSNLPDPPPKGNGSGEPLTPHQAVLDAERRVLGSALNHPSCVALVRSLLRAEQFYSDSHRKIFQAVSDLAAAGAPAEAGAVANLLAERGQVEDVHYDPRIQEFS
jgi:replicative DNA helicase